MCNILFVVLFVLNVCSPIAANLNECHHRNYGYGSSVCVCNANYCDTVPAVGNIPKNSAVVYTSSRQGLRLSKTIVNWSKMSVSNANFTIDTSQHFQKIEGFGGAFTDAAGINIAKLPVEAQNNLLSSYFGPGSIEYNIARIPIASCDFSTRNYSYDDIAGDFELEHFSLAEEDLTKKIPFIKRAMKLSNKPIKFFASPWSAPYWMKTNQMMQGAGSLIGQPGDAHYKAWAQYYVKFLDEYAKRGIHMWAVTAQNEPTTGFTDDYRFQVMAFTPQTQRDFIKLDLGPALRSSAHTTVTIMILDDRRYLLPKWAEIVLNDPEAAKFVSHVALHWYSDSYTPAEILDETHELFPDVLLFGTEACTGVKDKEDLFVKLGNWERGEEYAQNIIETLNHWYTGWTDWNLALGIDGGPNWVDNFVDSSIIVNTTSGEFYKQPMFYAIGHFSTFLPENSIRISISSNFCKVDRQKYLATAFVTPSKHIIFIILNKDENPVTVSIAEKQRDDILQINVPAKSIQTLIWS